MSEDTEVGVVRHATQAAPTGEPEARFQDGNLSDVVRIGATVRRVPGAWTPAVQALLRHLETVGFEGAPRARGFDDRGREVLTFVEGSTIPASLDGYRSDQVLVEAARLLRRYHDATVTFVPPPGAAWNFQVGATPGSEIICHNDVAPWNTVVRDGHPVAFIDFDYAAPGTRAWDVAYAVWRYVPLYDGEEHGTPAEQARRMHLFRDAYGLSDRPDLLPSIQHRMTVNYATLAAAAADRTPPFVAMWREGHGEGIVRDLAHLRRHWTTFEQSLGI